MFIQDAPLDGVTVESLEAAIIETRADLARYRASGCDAAAALAISDLARYGAKLRSLQNG